MTTFDDRLKLFKSELRSFENERVKHEDYKKKTILELAKLMEEEKQIKKEMISEELSRELEGYVTSRYVRECLDDAYKQKNQSRNSSAKKALVEVSSSGQEQVIDNTAELTQKDKEDIDSGYNNVVEEFDRSKTIAAPPQQLEKIQMYARELDLYRQKDKQKEEKIKELQGDLEYEKMRKSPQRFITAVLPYKLFDFNHKALLRSKTHIVLHIENNHVVEVFDDKEGKQLLIDAGIEVAE